MSTEQILLWGLGLLSTYLAIEWRQQREKNKRLSEVLNEKKVSVYSGLIKIFFAILQISDEKQETERKMKESIKQLRELNHELILYSSAGVYKVYGDLFSNFYKENDTKKTIQLFGEIIKEIRKDITTDNVLSNFQWFDSLRPVIKDLDKYVPERYRNDRGIYSKIYSVDKRSDDK
jgi:regulator of sigma D